MRAVVASAVVLSLVACAPDDGDSAEGSGGAGGGMQAGNPCAGKRFESSKCAAPGATCDHPGNESGLCVDGYWQTMLPAVGPAPFPEQTTCNPFGVWQIATTGNANAQCLPDDYHKLIVHRAEGSRVLVGFGQVSYAEISADGCQVIAETYKAYQGETTIYRLELNFTGAAPTGELRLSQLGFCSGTQAFKASGTQTGPDV